MHKPYADLCQGCRVNQTLSLMLLVVFLNGIWISCSGNFPDSFFFWTIILYIVRIITWICDDILYPKLLELKRLGRISCPIGRLVLFFFLSPKPLAKAKALVKSINIY